MSYKVIHFFTDLQDINHPYKVGDVFPRLGINVSEARLKELSSSNNKQGKPLIELVEEKEDLTKENVNTTLYTKTDIRRMPTAELKELATKKGIIGSEEMTGTDLKELLINHFEL